MLRDFAGADLIFYLGVDFQRHHLLSALGMKKRLSSSVKLIKNKRFLMLDILLFLLPGRILFSLSCGIGGVGLDAIPRKQLPDRPLDRLLDLVLLFRRTEDGRKPVGDVPRHPSEPIHQIREDASGELPSIFGQVRIMKNCVSLVRYDLEIFIPDFLLNRPGHDLDRFLIGSIRDFIYESLRVLDADRASRRYRKA